MNPLLIVLLTVFCEAEVGLWSINYLIGFKHEFRELNPFYAKMGVNNARIIQPVCVVLGASLVVLVFPTQIAILTMIMLVAGIVAIFLHDLHQVILFKQGK